MEKRILKGTQVGISTPKRQRHNSPVDIKKKKSAYEKEDKKIALPMCEKNGPDSPSGLARTARSARLRFCLFRRVVFIQGVCLSRRGASGFPAKRSAATFCGVKALPTCSRQAYA